MYFGLYTYKFEKLVNSDITTRVIPGGVVQFPNLSNDVAQPLFQTNVKNMH